MTSEVFELIASDDVRFFVHRDILIAQSKPFREATTGPWEEAKERKIHLTDWNSDTVAQLVEYFYTNDYSYPDPIHLNPDPTPSVNALDPVVPGAEAPAVPPDPGRPLTPFGEYFRASMPPERAMPLTDSERLQKFDPAQFDFENVLLTHAMLYVLANYKGIEKLQTLALKRLLLVLSRLHPLQPGSHIARNVAEFAKYVYANTYCHSRSEEPLRKHTSHYIALNMGQFQSVTEGLELMAEGGDFIRDVMPKICRRLRDPEPGISSGGQGNRYISNIKVPLPTYDYSG